MTDTFVSSRNPTKHRFKITQKNPWIEKGEKIIMNSTLWKPICEPSFSIRAVPREIKIRSRISPVGPSPPSFPEPERKCAKESEGFPPVILG